MHIEGNRLGRRFGRKSALSDATFECRSGEVIALIGNNGAGKTTLLQLIAGMLVPTSGEIFIEGKPLERRDETQRRRIAIIPDYPPYFANHTVIRHIAMVCALHHVEDEGLEQRMLNLMESAGILPLGSVSMSKLSRGEIYKTVLVALLLAKPGLWLLDEPMASGMDPQGLNFLRTQLREQAAAGATIIYSTQIADIAERFSDRVFVLNEGHLIAHESAKELMATHAANSLDEAIQKAFANADENLG